MVTNTLDVVDHGLTAHELTDWIWACRWRRDSLKCACKRQTPTSTVEYTYSPLLWLPNVECIQERAPMIITAFGIYRDVP